MRKDKDELERAASEPSLWDDPSRAQQVTSRLSHVQAEIGKVEGLRSRLDDAGVLLELAQAEDDPDSLAEVRSEVTALQLGDPGAGGPHAALGGVRLPRGAGDDPVRSRWGGCRRLRRDAAADVSAVGRAARLRHRCLRHVLRGGGRHQVRHLRGQGALCLRHPLRRAGHPPAGADLPIRQPGSPADQLRRGRGGPGGGADRRDRHPGRRDPGRRLSAPPARVARASTPPTRRSG